MDRFVITSERLKCDASGQVFTDTPQGSPPEKKTFDDASHTSLPVSYVVEGRVEGRDVKAPSTSLHQRIPKIVTRSRVESSPIPAFDLQLFCSEQQVMAALERFNAADSNADVVLISSGDGLGRDNLTQRLTIGEDGGQTITPGRLFNHPNPLILVLDIRQMSASEIATFNDLLDPDHPTLYQQQTGNKHPLGDHVKVRVLANLSQLTKRTANTLTAPGADLWRRVNRPENTLTADSPEAKQNTMGASRQPLLPEYRSQEATATVPVTIDLHLHSDWRQLLFGGPGVDQQGQIRHIPGQLERLQAGQTVILKGGDWGNLEFCQQIRTLKQRRQYQSNGRTCPLPDAIQFYRGEVGDGELADLLQTTVKLVTSPPKQPLVVNQTTLAQWLNPIKINRLGLTMPNTTLLEQIRRGGTVTVTSPLSETMWFRLLHQLQIISRETGQPPCLLVTDGQQQPEKLRLPKNVTSIQHGKLGRAVQAVSYRDQQQVTDYLHGLGRGPLVIQITDQSRLGPLLDNLHIASEKPPRFGRKLTQLHQALAQGQEVVILGLATNPALQQALESLNSPEPFLLINGVVQHYPKANIRLFWPKGKPCDAPFWRAGLETAEPLPDRDIWDAAASRHGLAPDRIPKATLEKLYQLFASIPIQQTQGIGTLPALTSALLDNLISAARQAQAGDCAQTLAPKHWRKGINSVLTHCTRQNPIVRDVLKVACEQLLPDDKQQPWVDPERLAQILRSFKTIDRATIRENFWPLARSFSPQVWHGKHLSLPHSDMIDDSATQTMYALLVCHAPDQLRDSLVAQLRPDPALVDHYQQQPLSKRSSLHRKRLEDALASGWSINREILTDVMALADECYALSQKAGLNRSERKAAIKEKLAKALIWQGTVAAPTADLADDLLHARTNQADRQRRRLSRLRERLADTPVVFIEGETATGKSYSAAQMAKESGPAFITSLGPGTDDRELVQRWVWREDLPTAGRTMERIEQILLQWARKNPGEGDQYVTLVLDEANLANKSVLASLNGLWDRPPRIYVDGQPLEVTDRHRVILTGNPVSYGGRCLDDDLLARIQRIHYPALDHAFLHDLVVVPALLKQLTPHIPKPKVDLIVTQTAAAIMTLWPHYRTLLPDHEFTPRDLTDICAWLGWYLNQRQQLAEEITQPQLNALVWQSFQDVLATEIDGQQQGAVFALECWFSGRYPGDNTLLSQAQLTTLVPAIEQVKRTATGSMPQFDSSSSAVATLVEALGQDLLRCQQAHGCQSVHGGRQATIIEGPTGRGKDVTLQLAVEGVRQQLKSRGQTMPQVHYLNACDCPWDSLRHHLQQARYKGDIVVVSELNLINSQHLEGELNAMLAGDAAPGFHLFATTNPPDYFGREPLSPALKGRFRYLPIRQYSQDELTSIAAKVLPGTEQSRACAAQLAEMHCRLRAELQRQGCPLQPVSQDLQNLAHGLVAQDKGPAAILALFNRYYRLYLLAAGVNIEELPGRPSARGGQAGCDQSLCRWLHQTLPSLSCPWQVRRGQSSGINSNTSVIAVPNSLDDKEAKGDLIKQLAHAQWEQSGMPLTAPEPTDMLKQALYRCWQQRWFATVYQATGVEAEQVFPVHELGNATLGLKVNQPYISAVETFMGTMDWQAERQRPGQWQQIVDIVNRPVCYYQQPSQGADQGESVQITTVPEVVVEQDRQPSLPPPCREQLDRATDYERQTVRPKCRQVFSSPSHHPALDRLCICELAVTTDGDLILNTVSGEYGLEVVAPGVLPVGEPISLAHNHHYGLTTLEWRHRQWFSLPSVTPHDTMIAVGTDPEKRWTVVRDLYTGLHMIDCVDGQPGEQIKVHFILESQSLPRELLPAQGQSSNRQDASCTKPMLQEIDTLFSGETLSRLPDQQRQQLLAIKQAPSPAQRIASILQYCEWFQGQTAQQSGSLLAFLLQQRQGSCRHRAPIFVALCRYFHIPARLVRSEVHMFVEYSLDNGQTWLMEDSGGAAGALTIDKPAFQPTRAGVTIGSGPGMAQMLKTINPGQVAALAEVLGLGEAEVARSLASGVPLPVGTISVQTTADIVRNLWEVQADRDAFTLGSELLKNRVIPDDNERRLLGSWYYNNSALALGAAVCIGPHQGIKPLLEELQGLYDTMVKGETVIHSNWQYSIVRILTNGCDRYGAQLPQIEQIARTALEQGWLNPEQGASFRAMALHDLLIRLEQVDGVKALVQSTLKTWYRYYLGRKSDTLTLCQTQEAGACLSIVKAYQGHSSTLESALKTSCLTWSWTDQPDGLPDIERLLVGLPAFSECRSGTTRSRPVILLGPPQWCHRELAQLLTEKTDQLCEQHYARHPADQALLARSQMYQTLQQQYELEIRALSQSKGREKQAQQVRPDVEGLVTAMTSMDTGYVEDEDLCAQFLAIREKYDQWIRDSGCQLDYQEHKRLRDIRITYANAVIAALTDYLYQTTNSQDGLLTLCLVGTLQPVHGDYGYYMPKSFTELMGFMLRVTSTGSDHLDKRRVQQTFQSNDALVLGGQEITEIAIEFLKTLTISVNIETIPEEVVARGIWLPHPI